LRRSVDILLATTPKRLFTIASMTVKGHMTAMLVRFLHGSQQFFQQWTTGREDGAASSLFQTERPSPKTKSILCFKKERISHDVEPMMNAHYPITFATALTRSVTKTSTKPPFIETRDKDRRGMFAVCSWIVQLKRCKSDEQDRTGRSRNARIYG
jgi:hypothetical protein